MISTDKDRVFKSSLKQSSCQRSCFVCGGDFENTCKYHVYHCSQKCLFGGVSILELLSFILDQKVLSDSDTLRVCEICSTLVSEASFLLHQFTTVKNKVYLLFNANKQPKLLSHLLPDNVSFDSLWPNSLVQECPKLNLEDLAESRPRKKKGKNFTKVKKSVKDVCDNVTNKCSLVPQLKLSDKILPSLNESKIVKLPSINVELEISPGSKNVLEKQNSKVILSENDKTCLILPKEGETNTVSVKQNSVMKDALQSEKKMKVENKTVVKESQCTEKLKILEKSVTLEQKLLNKERVMSTIDADKIRKPRIRRGGRPRKPFQCQHCHLKFYCNELLESHCKKYHDIKFCTEISIPNENDQQTHLVETNGNHLESSKESKKCKLEETNEFKSNITIEADDNTAEDDCKVINFQGFDQKKSVAQPQNESENWRRISEKGNQDSNINMCVCSQSLNDSSSSMFKESCMCTLNVSKKKDSNIDMKSSKNDRISESSNKMRRIEPRPRAVKKIEDDGSVIYILSSIGGGKVNPSLIKLSPEYVKYMNENSNIFSSYANGWSAFKKFNKLEENQKLNSKKLNLLVPINNKLSNQNHGTVPPQFSLPIKKKKVKSSNEDTTQKSSADNAACLPNYKYSGKKHKKFRVVSRDAKYKKNSNSSLMPNGKRKANTNPVNGTLKSTDKLARAVSENAMPAVATSVAQSCNVCGLSFHSAASLRKHCSDHLLVNALRSADLLDISSPSNAPVCATSEGNEPSVASCPDGSSSVSESPSPSPFPAVSITCTSLPDIKSPILDEPAPKDSSLSVLLPVLPEAMSMAPLVTTPTDLRHLLAAELDDRVCDWRSKSLQSLPENPMSMDIEMGAERLSSGVHELSSPVINDTNLQEESMDFDRPDDSVSLDATSGMKHPMMDVPFTPPSQNSEAIRDNEPFSHSLYHEEFSSPYNFKLVPELEPSHGYCMGESVGAVSSPLRVDLCSEASDVAGDDSALSASDRMSKKLQRVSSHL